ncbi:MAG: GNAT family N-acetyltransferase [Gemmatimonadaceae bacterium]
MSGGASEADHIGTTIRLATLADAIALADLGARTFVESYASATAPADIAEYLAATYSPDRQRAELEDPRSAVFVAERGESLSGYAWLYARTHASCDVGADAMELARIYVAREAAGQGLGSALLDALVDEARRRGARSLWLSVWTENASAIAFYERRAFTVVGSQPFRVGTDIQRDHVMARGI